MRGNERAFRGSSDLALDGLSSIRCAGSKQQPPTILPFQASLQVVVVGETRDSPVGPVWEGSLPSAPGRSDGDGQGQA